MVADRHDGLMCSTALTVLESDIFQAKNASLYGLTIQEADSKIQNSRAKFTDKCGSLSDNALKSLLQKALASELDQGSVEIRNDKFMDDPKALSGRRYSGKIDTLYGEKNFSAFVSESDGVVIRIERPYK